MATKSHKQSIPSTKGKNLVIVESPAKARTISQMLGDDFVVTASMGHVCDLPHNTMGVDITNNFSPQYTIKHEKRDYIKNLKQAAQHADNIYLATDPDREGEAIAWHIKNIAELDNNTQRITFHEITKNAVMDAFQAARDINIELVNAQQARRILDRLVGYEISPLLWKRIQKGISAGRVQSVALNLIINREKEIQDFITTEWWTLTVNLYKDDNGTQSEIFQSDLYATLPELEVITINNESEAELLKNQLLNASYEVFDISTKTRKQKPAPPFITSTLQQAAATKLHFSAQQTMVVAQQLYEGINIGDDGLTGLITYMRTDSTSIANDSITDIRKYISSHYPQDYLSEKPKIYESKNKNAQEAHEAIRPTDITNTPSGIEQYLNANQIKLYKLIWERTVASQMSDAILENTIIDIDATCQNNTQFRFKSQGSVIKFPGFRVLYTDNAYRNNMLPGLSPHDRLIEDSLVSNQHFTQPPPRYSEASLIKTLEQHGIGRPSTYATIIKTIVDRGYITKSNRQLLPTTTGNSVDELLSQYFSNIINLQFTSAMETQLDNIANGKQDYVTLLNEFYTPFQQQINGIKEIFQTPEKSEELCEQCNDTLIVKISKYGKFLACPNYPKCKYIKNINPEQEVDELKNNTETDEICDKCQQPMVIKYGKYGKFLACSGYKSQENSCDNRKPIVDSSGVKCPHCSNDIVKRFSKKTKRPFWGCSGYPQCTLILNNRPIEQLCTECQNILVITTKNIIQCSNKECNSKH